MPERAEVYVTAELLNESLGTTKSYYRPSYIKVLDSRVLSGCTESDLKKKFSNISAENRVYFTTYGKYVFMACGSDSNSALDFGLAIHLRMTGSLILSDSSKPLQYARMVIGFEHASGARQYVHFCDTRKFGTAEYFENESVVGWAFRAKAIRFDVWSSKEGHVLSAWKTARQEHPSWPIKKVLLEPEIVSGIGNYMANEALFSAAIHPATAMILLSDDHLKTIYYSLIYITNTMIDLGGVSMKDFVMPSGARGNGQRALLVYGKENCPCPNCKSNIEKESISRSAFFCPRCQRKRIVKKHKEAEISLK
jgi:formamidopyrimidine-DNA glycosylase